jgi:hypothetical protein
MPHRRCGRSGLNAKGGDASALEATRAEDERKLTELAKVKPTKPRTITEHGKETNKEHWQASDAHGHRQMLIDHGVKVYAAKGHEPRIVWPEPTIYRDTPQPVA